jgi:hypothetical protein
VDRIASTWSNISVLTVNVDSGDGQPHRVGLYLLDWDSTTRRETLEILDPSTGAVLDSRSAVGFNGGQYWTWVVTGSIRIRVIHTGGENAVVSGVFLDPAAVPAPNQPPTVSITSPVEGASYGAPASIAVTADAADPDAGGSVAQVAFYGDGTLISTDTTAPYTASWTVTVAGTHTLTAVATDDKGASMTSAAVHAAVTGGTGPAVTFVGTDTTTQGTWKGVYGTQGYAVVNDTTSLPAGATVTASGQSSWTWAGSTTAVRALQKGTAADRIAATWYSSGTFTINVDAGDSLMHRISVYALDWDSTTRGETLEVLDPATGAVLDTRTLTAFNGGQYWTWRVSGAVRIRMTRTAGANAVVSGVFLDAP